MPLPLEKKQWTFADYLEWEEPNRVEIISGEAVMMASPSPEHQEISAELVRQLANFLEGKPCKVYPAPFDVRLFESDNDKPENVDTVVQPDISVVCVKDKKDKIDSRGCKGAPDLVIEILSPSTMRQDRLVKFNLYQQAGVREYWIVDPPSSSVQVFLPDSSGAFRIVEAYDKSGIARVNILEGCFIELSKVFPKDIAE